MQQKKSSELSTRRATLNVLGIKWFDRHVRKVNIDIDFFNPWLWPASLALSHMNAKLNSRCVQQCHFANLIKLNMWSTDLLNTSVIRSFFDGLSLFQVNARNKAKTKLNCANLIGLEWQYLYLLTIKKNSSYPWHRSWSSTRIEIKHVKRVLTIVWVLLS